MTKKEELYKYFSENENLERQAAIENAKEIFKVTTTTAVTYYNTWRKNYMKPRIATKNDFKKAIEKAVENAIIVPKERETVVTKELHEEPMKLIPVMFKGPVFTFSINQDGVKIVDGESDMVTENIVKEQLEALKLYEELYGSKAR